MRNGDAEYDRRALDKVSSTQFQIEQPKPVEEPEENCSPIAVADAQAAAALVEKETKIEAAKFEMRLDHTRDKHIRADVEGCPLCEGKVLPRNSDYVNPNVNMQTIEDEDDELDKGFPF